MELKLQKYDWMRPDGMVTDDKGEYYAVEDVDPLLHELAELRAGDVLGRKPADQLADAGDIYADVYCQIVDMIEPHVKRGFNSTGELPASVVNSFEILFEFWLEHKGRVKGWKLVPEEPTDDQINSVARAYPNHNLSQYARGIYQTMLLSASQPKGA